LNFVKTLFSIKLPSLAKFCRSSLRGQHVRFNKRVFACPLDKRKQFKTHGSSFAKLIIVNGGRTSYNAHCKRTRTNKAILRNETQSRSTPSPRNAIPKCTDATPLRLRPDVPIARLTVATLYLGRAVSQGTGRKTKSRTTTEKEPAACRLTIKRVNFLRCTYGQ